MKNFKAIIFGSIGTVLETSDIQRKSFNKAFKKFGLNWYWSKNEYKKLLKVSGGENRLSNYANTKNINPNDNFLYYLNEVNSIISKLEVLENEKNKLKDQLKNYEQEFINKKKKAEDKINSMTQEKKMFEKTINVIKNLKSF